MAAETNESDSSGDEFYDPSLGEESDTSTNCYLASFDRSLADQEENCTSANGKRGSLDEQSGEIKAGDLTVKDVLEVEEVDSPKGHKTLEPRMSIVVAGEVNEEQVLDTTLFKNLDSGEVMTLAEGLQKVAESGADPLTLAMGARQVTQNTTQTAEKKKGTATGGKRFFSRFKGAAPHNDSFDTKSVDIEVGEDKPGLKLVQSLEGGQGKAIWAMKFSLDGKLLAAAGQDGRVLVWAVCGQGPTIADLKGKYSDSTRISQCQSNGNLDSPNSEPAMADQVDGKAAKSSVKGGKSKQQGKSKAADSKTQTTSKAPLFDSEPIIVYEGHTADILDISWSKNYFLLTSSMDKTVRLWHISQPQCLCCYQHPDFVTAIAFHPTDDRYFLSTSLDMRLRLWVIPQKRVVLWNEVSSGAKRSLITAANFVQNGAYIAVGTYDGRCLFYDSERLKYLTQISVKSSRKKVGKKISGILPLEDKKLLVTSNDSRLRLYNMADYSLEAKFLGHVNVNSQIRASASDKGRFLASGSENGNICIWATNPEDLPGKKLPSGGRHYPIEVYHLHDDPVTVTQFAPPDVEPQGKAVDVDGRYLVTADTAGRITVLYHYLPAQTATRA